MTRPDSINSPNTLERILLSLMVFLSASDIPEVIALAFQKISPTSITLALVNWENYLIKSRKVVEAAVNGKGNIFSRQQQSLFEEI